ncbi:predicted protein [Arabidopsis lyrata subsp. lyrata]|uniref:Predicted protein n=1 Tax=Arabidopsis lyrata subsp. lyrata TaxID=81972 RepID=D7LE13_ARALL|nr:predicted protein [Arabidopsis lyrata subsp. lyrata]
MSEPVSSVSPPGDSSPVQSKQLSYAAAVNKRPSLKKHEFQVSLVDGIPTIEVPSAVIKTSVPVEVQEVQTPTLAVSNAVQQNRAAETHEEQDNITQGAGKDGWSLVSPGKGCKSNEKVQSSLAYGQIILMSPS